MPNSSERRELENAFLERSGDEALYAELERRYSEAQLGSRLRRGKT